MPLTLREHGDIIEKDYAELIESRLTGYSKIWQSYIGHDGKGHHLSLDGIDEKEESIRNRFVQYHYSSLESIISMIEIVNALKGLGDVSVDSKRGRKDYIFSLNFFMAFYAHAGRVRDLVKKMSEIWQQEKLIEKFEEFYQQRNNVLHEAKLPIAFIAEAIAILPPAGKEDEQEKWGRNRIWGEVDVNLFEELIGFLDKFLQDILVELNNFLESLFSQSIFEYTKNHPLILNDNNELDMRSTTISGSRNI